MHLYQEHLLDHYKYPRNRGVLHNPTFVISKDNPLCGDSVSLQVILVDGRIVEIAFQGEGCVVSQAATSMLTELCCGKTLQEIQTLSGDTMRDLVKIQLGPTRLKCALLPLHALHDGLAAYGERENDAQSGEVDQTGTESS